MYHSVLKYETEFCGERILHGTLAALLHESVPS